MHFREQIPRLSRFCCLLAFLAMPFISSAYSVLSHEALIDANWEKTIMPALKTRYPRASDEDLKNAKAYAYGGAVSPDMGYYPFGSKLFTNLLHYVRSGDFVQTLLDSASTLNEFAYALGVLNHYMADTYGHPLGTNRSVPIEYPKVRRKFGNEVTYAEDKVAHLRVEFSFDVLQTARGNYASAEYHKYIGFNVADTLLDKAFRKTYGLELHEIFPDFKLALNTFRWTVKNFFPELTHAAWAMKKNEIRKTNPGATSRKFTYHMHRKQYYHEFGRGVQHPGFFARILAGLIRILPKVGPLRALSFKAPSPQAEKYFVQSFDTVLVHYKSYVDDKLSHTHRLPDRDYDTGNMTEPGEYPLCDAAYKDLVLKLKDKHFQGADPSLKKNINNFYNQDKTARQDKDWSKVSEALQEMNSGG